MITITDGQTDVILDDIQEDAFWHDNHHKSLKDNVETFDFVTFANRGFSEYLAKRNRIIIPDEDGKYIEFIIHNTRKYRSPQGGLFIEVYTMASYTELATSKVIRPQKTPSWTPKQHVEFALAGTGYEAGQVDHGGFRTLTIEQYTNPFAYLKRVASVYDFELHFRIEENGNRVTRRYVDLIQRVGNWQGREVEFGKDLLGIERKEDTSKIVTALIGLSPEREDGTRLELLVEDKEALARWGRNGQHIIDIYEPESTDTEMTEERLRTLTENELKKRVNSVVEYTADIADLEKVPGLEHEKVRFGDVIRIKDIDFNPPLYLEARIHTMERSIKKNGRKTVALGDYIEYTEEEVQAIWKALQAQIARKVSMSDVLEVTYTKEVIDQKDIPGNEAKEKIDRDVGEAIIESVVGSQKKADQAEENAKEHADDAASQAEQNAKSHADNVASQAQQAAITEAVSQAQSALNTAVGELESSIAEKAEAKWVEEQLQLKADSSTVTAIHGTVSDLQDTASSLQQAVDNHADQLEEQGGKITKLETDYDELEGSLNATITELSNLNETVSRHETQIEANAREIALKASQQEFDSLSGTVSDISGQLTVMAGKIEAKAEKSELEELEDDVSQINTELSSLKVDVEGISTNVSNLSQTVTNHGTQISNINSSITQLSGEIESKVDKTEYETDKDGIINRLDSTETRITQTEQDIQARVTKTEYQQDKQELEGGISQLETRMSTAETNIQANTTAISLKANKTDVYTKTQVDQELGKKVDTTVYNQKIGELTTSINGISANVSNLQTTVGQHGTSISNLQSQVNIQADQIATKVDATFVNSAIDAIRVGGRNLLPGTSDKDNTVSWTGWDYKFLQVNDIAEIGLRVGDELYFRVYIAETNARVRAFVQFTQNDGSGNKFKQKWGNVIGIGQSGWSELKFTITEEDIQNLKVFTVSIRNVDNTTATITYRKAKMELGNKPTDWTPAPEDIQAEIDDVYQYASSEIQQLAGQVSTKAEASTVTALGNRVTTAEQNISALESQISQKVSQSTFNALENRVTQAESTITQTADNVTVAFNRIDSIDGKLNSATTIIDETGVTVKNGSFFLVDEISNMKSHAVFRRNYIKDHSFEALKEGDLQSDNTRTLIITAKNPWSGWFAVGNPKLSSIFGTDAPRISVMFGLKEAVVNNSNYLYQYIHVFPNQTYTFSVHARKYFGLTAGNLRVRIRCWKPDDYGNPIYVLTKNFDFSTSGNTGVIARYGGTFTTTSDTEHIEISVMTTSSNWIAVDGVQLVDGNYPSPYVPEDDLYAFMHGLIQGQEFAGDYTIVNYGSNENGNFVRFGQGLQICWFQTEINMAINNQYGVLYQNSMKWTYPATFADIPNVCVGEARWSTGASWGTPTTTERLSTDIRVIDVSSRNAGPTRIKAIAIGRWK